MDLQFRNSLIFVYPEKFVDVPFVSLLPRVLSTVGGDKVLCAQIVGRSRFRLTFINSAACDSVFDQGLSLDNCAFHVLRADPRFRSVYVKDLPFEVSDPVVSKFFDSFGTVSSVNRLFFKDFPTIATGTRRVDMLLTADIPSSVRISDSPCRVSYSRQSPSCSVCHASDHRAPACALSGLCRRCRLPGHMARECRQAWGPRPVVLPSASSVSLDPDPDPDPDPVPTPASVPVPVVPAPSVPVPAPASAPPVLFKVPSARSIAPLRSSGTPPSSPSRPPKFPFNLTQIRSVCSTLSPAVLDLGPSFVANEIAKKLPDGLAHVDFIRNQVTPILKKL